MQDDLNQNIRSHLEAGCFQQGRGRKKGFHYKERDLFSSFSPLKRKKGDKRKTRPELSHPDKNFLVFTTCKINFYFFSKEMHFCYLANMTALGEKYSLLVPICRSDRTKEHTTFLLFKIFIYLIGEGEKSQEETERKLCQEC